MSSSWGDALSVKILRDSNALAAAAAADVAAVLRLAVQDRGEANAMFATGNSQLATLERLVALKGIPWAQVRVFHMDQYVGLDPEHPASFSRYIRERIVARVKPSPLGAHYVDTDSRAVPEYAALLRAHPLDLCVMGIGENGHLAFNDPPVADFDDPLDVKAVGLDAACRRQQVGEGHFASLADVPTHAVTVTIPALLRAGQVIVVCPEVRKAPAVAAALGGPITTECPASVLRRCDHARLYLDADSASLIVPQTYRTTSMTTSRSRSK
jgi:glucosamine-6-phosphate deaminase